MPRSPSARLVLTSPVTLHFVIRGLVKATQKLSPFHPFLHVYRRTGVPDGGVYAVATPGGGRPRSPRGGGGGGPSRSARARSSPPPADSQPSRVPRGGEDGGGGGGDNHDDDDDDDDAIVEEVVAAGSGAVRESGAASESIASRASFRPLARLFSSEERSSLPPSPTDGAGPPAEDLPDTVELSLTDTRWALVARTKSVSTRGSLWLRAAARRPQPVTNGATLPTMTPANARLTTAAAATITTTTSDGVASVAPPAASAPTAAVAATAAAALDEDADRTAGSAAFPPLTLSAAVLCNSDARRPLRVEVWHQKRGGGHRRLAAGQLNVGALLRATPGEVLCGLSSSRDGKYTLRGRALALGATTSPLPTATAAATTGHGSSSSGSGGRASRHNSSGGDSDGCGVDPPPIPTPAGVTPSSSVDAAAAPPPPPIVVRVLLDFAKARLNPFSAARETMVAWESRAGAAAAAVGAVTSPGRRRAAVAAAAEEGVSAGPAAPATGGVEGTLAG
ncbi:hypothetical protein MMPV_003687 [Pyropia vietnamensis]